MTSTDGRISTQYTFDIESFRQSLVARGRSEATAAKYASQVQRFVLWHAAPEYDAGRCADDFARWINQGRAQGDSPSITRQRLAAARAWLDHRGESRGPLGDYKAPPLPAPNPTPLPNGMIDVARMVGSSPHNRLARVVALGGYAGLRVSESLSIRWDDYDRERRQLTVHGKGEKVRIVPVSDRLAAVLASRSDLPSVFDPDRIAGGLTDSQARKAISQLAYEVGLEDVSSHDLRATFATELFRATKDVLLVSKLLGHSSIATTQAYLSFDRDAAAQAVNAL